MPHHVKRIARATAAKTTTYAGPAGELVMDITNNDLVLQNGQAGGVRLAKASTVIDAANGVSISTGGTLGATTVVSGVNATTSAKGVVQLSNATTGTSQTMAATPKAVSDALQAAKNYADTAVAGATPNVSNATGVLPIAHGGTGSSTKNFVDLTTNQTVAGTKAFTSNPRVKNEGPVIILQQTDITKGTNPSNNQAASIFMTDSAGTAGTNRTGQLVNAVDANGLTSTTLAAYQFANGSANAATLGVFCSADGNTKYATAPTPAAGDNSTKIATTAWVNRVLAPVYVNASTGNDANYGDTANTAVKTITKALELAANRGASDVTNDAVTIYIAAGTYNGSIFVACRARFVAQGAVTIGGDLICDSGVLHLFSQNNGSYRITGELTCADNGLVVAKAPLTVTASVAAKVGASIIVSANLSCANISSSNTSCIVVDSNASVTINSSAQYAVLSRWSSSIHIVQGNVTITHTNGVASLRSHACSAISFAGTGRLTINGSTSLATAQSTQSSDIYIANTAAVNGNVTGRRYYVDTGSTIYVDGSGINRIPGTQPGTVSAETYGVYA